VWDLAETLVVPMPGLMTPAGLHCGRAVGAVHQVFPFYCLGLVSSSSSLCLADRSVHVADKHLVLFPGLQ
jgi:hypothetical protein